MPWRAFELFVENNHCRVLKQDLLWELISLNSETTLLVIREPALRDGHRALPVLIYPATVRIIERKFAFHDFRSHRVLPEESRQPLLDLLTIGCSSVRRCEPLLRNIQLQLRILCLRCAPRDDHATQAVPSELASLKGEAGVHDPTPSASLRLLQLIIFDGEVREVPRRGLVRFLMHLLDIDVVHLVLVEFIRGDINRGQGQVENGQAIASRSCDLVIKDVNLQVMHAELRGVL
jgi:hypothetical protein